ncbi:hypothetical protein D3C81_699500 [compost metagenome]
MGGSIVGSGREAGARKVPQSRHTHDALKWECVFRPRIAVTPAETSMQSRPDHVTTEWRQCQCLLARLAHVFQAPDVGPCQLRDSRYRWSNPETELLDRWRSFVKT